MKVQVVDYRSDEEKQIEEKARIGESLGPEADRLTAELIEIGRTDYYLYYRKDQDKQKFNEDMQHIRTREIGRKLYEMGGHNLMLAAYYRIIAKLGNASGRSLEMAWGCIGDRLP